MFWVHTFGNGRFCMMKSDATSAWKQNSGIRPSETYPRGLHLPAAKDTSVDLMLEQQAKLLKSSTCSSMKSPEALKEKKGLRMC